MLDIKLIRENPHKVKAGIASKGADSALVDKILKADEERRKLQVQLDTIKAEKNKLGKEINTLSAEERDARIAALRAEDAKADTLEEEYVKVEEELQNLLLQTPNLPDDDVPVGPGESANVVIRTVVETAN